MLQLIQFQHQQQSIANFTKSGYDDWFLPSYYQVQTAQIVLWEKYGTTYADKLNSFMTCNTLPYGSVANMFGRIVRVHNTGSADKMYVGPKNSAANFLPMREF